MSKYESSFGSMNSLIQPTFYFFFWHSGTIGTVKNLPHDLSLECMTIMHMKACLDDKANLSRFGDSADLPAEKTTVPRCQSARDIYIFLKCQNII